MSLLIVDVFVCVLCVSLSSCHLRVTVKALHGRDLFVFNTIFRHHFISSLREVTLLDYLDLEKIKSM